MRWVGNLLIAASLLGFVVLGLMAAEIDPPWVAKSAPAAVAVSQPGTGVAAAAPFTAPEAPRGSSAPAVAVSSGSSPAPTAVPGERTAPTPVPRLAIERIEIASIGLDAPVVPAALIVKDGALQWEIPAHKAGHADGTAGAGDRGNAVLLGHVNSVRSGDVFRDLDKVTVDDRIIVHAGGRAFMYVVTETKTIDRADTSMVQTTDKASLTIFTCTGVWLPTIWDYTERLVVRAELREITA
jgi:LPXTG-site transpeptidase (sortase) family protein